jgi:hypothetical protein
MQTILTSLKNPYWANEAHSEIICEITTTQFGDEVLPFAATSYDNEPHGRAIFQDIVDGKYGAIGEYVAPAIPSTQNQPTVVGAQTL